jgi:hypothetical protein
MSVFPLEAVSAFARQTGCDSGESGDVDKQKRAFERLD